MVITEDFRMWDRENEVMKYDLECIYCGVGKRLEYIYMQYTGRRDMLGQKVYEKDIVKAIVKYVEGMPLNWEVKTKEVIGVVEWNEEGYWTLKILDDKYMKEAGFFTFKEIVKVLGNVFENPEFLKGEER